MEAATIKVTQHPNATVVIANGRSFHSCSIRWHQNGPLWGLHCYAAIAWEHLHLGREDSIMD